MQPSCAGKNFGDKGGLDRHKREVHESPAYTCPIPFCPRNKKGFGRKYNLWEHQKRRHRLQTPGLHRVRSNTFEELSESEDATQRLRYDGLRYDNDEEANGEIVGRIAVTHKGEANTEQGLKSKLRDLLDLRAELDEDIMSLQKALRIIGGASQ
jgi:hypothetical protein